MTNEMQRINKAIKAEKTTVKFYKAHLTSTNGKRREDAREMIDLANDRIEKLSAKYARLAENMTKGIFS